MKIKAVLFDMDGVLIDAREWHYESLNKALNLFGYNISRYDHLVTFDGLPTKKKLEMLSLDSGLPKGLHSYINELKQLYTIDIIHASCRPKFQHQYLLSKLKGKGVKLAVCSNSIRKTVELMMEKSKLMQYFDILMSNQDVVNGKPDPEIYLKAMSFLGFSPDECLIVEDNQNGIKAAKAAGANVMCVSGPEEVSYSNIDKFISNLYA